MRIAFVAPYQGTTVVERRPIVRNLSLGSRVKIELMAELLQRCGNSVEVLSQGEVVDEAFTRYPGFTDPRPFNRSMQVHYCSCVPVRYINGWWSSTKLLQLFKQRHKANPFDVVFTYNLKPPQVACSNYALASGLPVVLEYEDAVSLGTIEDAGLTARVQLVTANRLLASISGCVAGSTELLAQAHDGIPKLFLPGVVSDQIGRGGANERKNWVVFSGTHSAFQGLEHLVSAWHLANIPGWELHIAGHGAVTETLHRMAAGKKTIVFHGVLGREDNARLLRSGRVTVVPYEVSQTKGFSFKTIECLAAGIHVISTRLTALEGLDPKLKSAMTFIDDNAPRTVASALEAVILERRFERTASEATMARYGPEQVGRSLRAFVNEVLARHRQRAGDIPAGAAPIVTS